MADLTGNTGWKSTPNPAIKQRLNWAITRGTSVENSSQVIISLWLKKDPAIQNEPTYSTDCRFNIECNGVVHRDVQISNNMTLNANNQEMCVARVVLEAVVHNVDGTKTTTLKASGGFGGTSISYYSLNISKSVTFPAINRASSLSNIASTVIGNNARISFTPYSRFFYYKFRMKFGSTTYYIRDGSGNEVVLFPNSTSTYSFTRQIPSELISKITTATSGTMTAYLYTYADAACTKLIGSASVKTFTITVPSNIVPTILNHSVYIINKEIDGVDVISDWQVNVDGFTKYTYVITARGSNGSTIKSMTISGDLYNAKVTNIVNNGDGTYTCTYVGAYKTINATKNTTTKITVQDSRGRVSTAVTQNEYVYGYSNPAILMFNAERDNSDSSIINVKTSSSFSSINNHNTLIGSIAYRETGTSDWIPISSINPNTGYTPVAVQLSGGDVFEDNKAYELQLAIYDDLGGEAFFETYVGTAAVFLDLRAGGNGLGIGKIAESDAVEVAFPTKFYYYRLKVENNIAYPMNDMLDSHICMIGNNSLENNFVLYDISTQIYLRKIGNFVNICGAISSTVNIDSSNMQTGKRFMTLLEKFRPLQEVCTVCQGSGKNTWLLTIKTNGEVWFSRYGASSYASVTGKAQNESGRVWLPFNVTYMAGDGLPIGCSDDGIMWRPYIFVEASEE